MTKHRLRTLFHRWSGLVGLLAVMAPGITHADEWFVKVEGAPGELTEGPFAGWTRVNSVGALASVKTDTNGTTTRSVACEMTKAFDRLSPALLKSCGSGERIGRMTFAYVLSRPRATQYRIAINDVLVSSMRHDSARSSSGPETVEKERVALSFAKIEWSSFDLDENGGAAGGFTSSFDQLTGEGGTKLRSAFRATLSRQDGRGGVIVTWPAEEGRRYRILSQAALAAPWKTLLEHTASQDGTASQFVATDTPSLFMRVEELE